MMFVEAKLLDDLLSVDDACPTGFESSEKDHLECCSPCELEPFHVSTELGDIKVYLLDIDLFFAKIDPDGVETYKRENS